MPDITMCSPKQDCPKKRFCYRYLSTPNTWQSYHDFSENKSTKKCFIKYNNKGIKESGRKRIFCQKT